MTDIRKDYPEIAQRADAGKFVVRVVLWGSTITHWVACDEDELTRDHAKAWRFDSKADAFQIAATWERGHYAKSCVDVFHADSSKNDGEPLQEDE